MREDIVACRNCRKLIWKSAIECIWCGSINEFNENNEEESEKPLSPKEEAIVAKIEERRLFREPIERLFWTYSWTQLNQELATRYNLNPEEWHWLGDSQEGHHCPISYVENGSGELINPKFCCHFIEAWFDWDCKQTCKQEIPNGINESDKKVYEYYKPEPNLCGIIFYWDLLYPRKADGSNCIHDLSNLPQKNEFGKPTWIVKN
jgi:hypothetical protein